MGFIPSSNWLVLFSAFDISAKHTLSYFTLPPNIQEKNEENQMKKTTYYQFFHPSNINGGMILNSFLQQSSSGSQILF